MKRKRNALIQKYMKWTVKSPLTILTLIVMGLGSLIYLACTTESNVYRTYEGTVTTAVNGSIYIQAKVDENPLGSSVFWYVDKQEAIFSITDFSIDSKNDHNLLNATVKEEHRSLLTPSETIYVDIVVDKITIFSRMISRGKPYGN